MSRFIVARLLTAVPLMLGMIFIVMASFTLVPGDPAAVMLGEFARPEAIAALRAELGLDDPLLVRYVRYVAQLARGDLGDSLRDGRPVSVILAEVMPYTLKLALSAIVVAVVVGVPLGIIAAARANTWIDGLISVVSLAGLSMPVFWTAIIFIVALSVNLKLFPIAGTGTWKHLVLPAVTLALPTVGVLTRVTRTSMMEMLRSEFVRTAYAKGLGDVKVLTKHVLRNALVPILTALGLQLGQMLGGAVLTETVFAWPGMGRLTVFAVSNRDYILMQGLVLVLAGVYLVINLLVDVSYSIVDPRVRYQ